MIQRHYFRPSKSHEGITDSGTLLKAWLKRGMEYFLEIVITKGSWKESCVRRGIFSVNIPG